ncbi:uncharacterized protein EAE98_002233 [Botrytis deweyae]|uniref:SRR1-like domain-containing protein n=1 Tax=Botrytis deweyae TaxID=2478750 RepID=A0ABQ7IWQ2_9HELO|nr:uncharacterized protein EAE98_002233 [Botrytis deweyae]KAF7936014.1 hypothetical protein EAE98_002233 [Botrytis deweyae]
MSTDHKSPKSLFPPVSQPSQYTPPPRRNLPAEIPRIPDHDDPSTEWLPIYNTRTPYDEAEIVHLIHEIVRNFVRLSTVSEAEVIWPPEGGHRLDEALCNELNISDAARSLIRLLPCPGNCICPIFLYQSSQLFDILDNGFSLHTIRVVSITDDGPDLSNPPNTPLERPNDVVYYRNYWPRHAPSFLRMQLNRIKALDAIPPGQSALGYIDFADEWMRRKIKHYLEGTYGWPDNFNQQAWDEDRDRIWEETEEEYARLGRPHVLRFL